MSAVACSGQGEGDGVLHHSLGDSGVVDVVDVLRLLVEIAVEVYYLRFTSVNANAIRKSVLIEEIEGGFHDDVNPCLLGIIRARELVCQ